MTQPFVQAGTGRPALPPVVYVPTSAADDPSLREVQVHTVEDGRTANCAEGEMVPRIATSQGVFLIDSFFENGPDVGEALSEGVEALGDTAPAIGDGIGGAVSAVGGWFD
ncbi:MAG: hypothetical protein PGN15_06435 [Aeromicrobium erythreum]